jgi:hypothetical protein
MKPLTEIKKGCGMSFISFQHEDIRIRSICGEENRFFKTCQALLEQAQEFEKMILDELDFLKRIYSYLEKDIKGVNYVVGEEIKERIELLKEVQGEKQ